MALFLFISGLTLTTNVIFGHDFTWWMPQVYAFVGGMLFGKRSWQVFSAAFLAIFLLYIGIAAYRDSLSDGRLSAKLIMSFQLSSPYLLYLFTGLLGIPAGLSAVIGYKIKRFFYKEP